MVLLDAASPDTESALAVAWQMSGVFLTQTLIAFAQHPGIVLLYAAPPATERAWVLLRSKPIPAWWLPSMEGLVAIWRLLLCAVALWVVLTPVQIAFLRGALTSSATFQAALDTFSENVNKGPDPLLWELAFFLAVFFLLNWLLSLIAHFWIEAPDLEQERRENQRLALAAVARNLLLIPLALIYVAVVVRHIFFV